MLVDASIQSASDGQLFKVVLGAVSDLCNALAGGHLHGVWHTNTVAVTDFPFSHSILFIVDPTYTVPLIVAFVGALIFKPDRAMRVTAVALVFSTGYLVWSSAAKLSIDAKVASALTERASRPRSMNRLQRR